MRPSPIYTPCLKPFRSAVNSYPVRTDNQKGMHESTALTLLPLGLGALFTAWTMLRLIGGERERRAKELANAIAKRPSAAAEAMASKPAHFDSAPAAGKLAR